MRSRVLVRKAGVPSRLACRRPSPHDGARQEKALFVATHIISAVFAPFVIPFVTFFLLFFFACLHVVPLRCGLAILTLICYFAVLLPVLNVCLFRGVGK